MDFLPEKIDEYVSAHTSKESNVLYDLNRETNMNVLHPRMLSGHLQGRVLAMYSHMVKPKNILEIGTYTGYSAICLSEGLQADGKIYTIDINPELELLCSAYFEKAGISEKIDFRIGDALGIVPQLDVVFDMVFIDADKGNYLNYYNLVFDKVAKGGYIIADNVLWSGKVVEKVAADDEDTKTLISFNQKLTEDSRVENILLPVRDGLMIARKL